MYDYLSVELGVLCAAAPIADIDPSTSTDINVVPGIDGLTVGASGLSKLQSMATRFRACGAAHEGSRLALVDGVVTIQKARFILSDGDTIRDDATGEQLKNLVPRDDGGDDDTATRINIENFADTQPHRSQAAYINVQFAMSTGCNTQYFNGVVRLSSHVQSVIGTRRNVKALIVILNEKIVANGKMSIRATILTDLNFLTAQVHEAMDQQPHLFKPHGELTAYERSTFLYRAWRHVVMHEIPIATIRQDWPSARSSAAGPASSTSSSNKRASPSASLRDSTPASGSGGQESSTDAINVVSDAVAPKRSKKPGSSRPKPKRSKKPAPDMITINDIIANNAAEFELLLKKTVQQPKIIIRDDHTIDYPSIKLQPTFTFINRHQPPEHIVTEVLSNTSTIEFFLETTSRRASIVTEADAVSKMHISPALKRHPALINIGFTEVKFSSLIGSCIATNLTVPRIRIEDIVAEDKVELQQLSAYPRRRHFVNPLEAVACEDSKITANRKVDDVNPDTVRKAFMRSIDTADAEDEPDEQWPKAIDVGDGDFVVTYKHSEASAKDAEKAEKAASATAAAFSRTANEFEATAATAQRKYNSAKGKKAKATAKAASEAAKLAAEKARSEADEATSAAEKAIAALEHLSYSSLISPGLLGELGVSQHLGLFPLPNTFAQWRSCNQDISDEKYANMKSMFEMKANLFTSSCQTWPLRQILGEAMIVVTEGEHEFTIIDRAYNSRFHLLVANDSKQRFAKDIGVELKVRE